MPDQNDSIRAPYQLDIEGLVSWIYSGFSGSGGDVKSLYSSITAWWYVFSIVSFAVSALLLVGIVYSIIRYSELVSMIRESLREQERAYRQGHVATGENEKWQRILVQVSADSPNDWRLAIVEADIMLGELLDSLGYIGASIGDKLKTTQPEAFRSIEDAWNAHKVRNAIAHRGSDFVLTKRVAQEAIVQYQRVFEEFKFI